MPFDYDNIADNIAADSFSVTTTSAAECAQSAIRGYRIPERLRNAEITFCAACLFAPNDVESVEFHPPATKMIFKDGTSVTAVAQDGDEYDKEIGMMVCILKRMFGGSGYNNLFRKWIKNDEKKKKDIERANKEIEEKKIVRERQRAKKIKKKIEKRKAAEQRQAEIQKQAFLEALKEWSLMPLENMFPGEED